MPQRPSAKVQSPARAGAAPLGPPQRMTARSAKWMESVMANFATATGKPAEAWVKQVKAQGFDRDIKASRRWLKETKGLTMVQANCVLTALFPESGEEDLLSAQYAGPKASLRPVYDRLAKVARSLGDDVMIAPRKSQVTFARDVTFAVVRAGAKDRVDLALRLPGAKPTSRLIANPKAIGSDPTHVVALGSTAQVDGEIVKWLEMAYRAAAR
jgi:hypothetical protein